MLARKTTSVSTLAVMEGPDSVACMSLDEACFFVGSPKVYFSRWTPTSVPKYTFPKLRFNEVDPCHFNLFVLIIDPHCTALAVTCRG